MSKRLVSPVNNPKVAYIDDFKPDILPAQLPILSQEARAYIQYFAVSMGVPADRLVSEAILYWWDNDGAYRVLERTSN